MPGYQRVPCWQEADGNCDRFSPDIDKLKLDEQEEQNAQGGHVFDPE